MTDKQFQKQLEKFGIESTLITEDGIETNRRTAIGNFNPSIIKMLMDTMEGRQWIYSKLDFYCVNATPFVPGKPDVTAFLCGLQEAGHQLQGEVITAAPNEYSIMLQEAAARAQNLPITK